MPICESVISWRIGLTPRRLSSPGGSGSPLRRPRKKARSRSSSRQISADRCQRRRLGSRPGPCSPAPRSLAAERRPARRRLRGRTCTARRHRLEPTYMARRRRPAPCLPHRRGPRPPSAAQVTRLVRPLGALVALALGARQGQRAPVLGSERFAHLVCECAFRTRSCMCAFVCVCVCMRWRYEKNRLPRRNPVLEFVATGGAAIRGWPAPTSAQDASKGRGGGSPRGEFRERMALGGPGFARGEE